MNPKIALCMMVKNEENIIGRALLSALPYVDAVCILDTGSTDGTLAAAHAVLGDVRYVVIEQGWVNFAQGRTQAARYAARMGCDYVLMLDADQTLEVSNPSCLQGLNADVYNLEIRHAGLVYPHPWLLNAALEWRWEGVTHEWLMDAGRTYGPPIRGAYLWEHGDSHRRLTGAKRTEDRALLEAAYAEDPTDARTVFYLGQCCQDEGKWRCAIEWYMRRVRLGGWLEEAWCAQYRVGNCHELGKNWEAAVMAYLNAYQLFPTRAEPLFRLGNGYFLRHQFQLARLFFDQAAQIDPPSGGLFVEAAVYDYAALQGYAWSCRALGMQEDAESAEALLVGNPGTPTHVVDAVANAIATKRFGVLV